MTTLQSYALADRPREKLRKFGAPLLSNAELIAILLNTSGLQGFSVIDLARTLLGPEDSLRALAERCEELRKKLLEKEKGKDPRFRGIGDAKLAILLSACEIAYRMTEEKTPLPARFTSPVETAQYFYARFRDMKDETCLMLHLDASSRIRGEPVSIADGAAGLVSLHPRDVFRSALEHHASGIVLLHNHPSGDPTPSDHDRVITSKLSLAGKQLGIPLVDHLIIGDARYHSFAEHGDI